VRPNLTLSSCLTLFALVVASPAGAQNQASLEKAFEGREVTVLLDMPASHQGVDLYLQREPEMEFGEYARRVKAYGVSLRKEDRVMITTIKVNKKNIEIHLGGGGYGTWGDDSGYVSPTYVGKSSREQDLEKERKNTTDADRRRRIDRELSYLREEREREERANKREAEALTAIKQREIASKRLDGGSRFNIWYADKRLEKWAPTPEELMLSLAKYLDFGGSNGDGVPGVMRGTEGNRLVDSHDSGRSTLGPARLRDVESASTSLRRGMSTGEVHDLLGNPTRRRSSKQGDLDAVVETWETTDSVTEVTFVGGVVVKFTSSSK
jgi:hypothetical protein